MDRRMQKTKTAIYNAFNKLLTTESYNKITVQEIIDEANIGRSTFYAHYETKDELLKEMCQNIFHHVIASDLHQEKTHNFSAGNKSLNSLLTHILYHIKDESVHMKGLLVSENGEYFWKNFRVQASLFIREYLLPDRKKTPSIPEDVLINHISVTFEGLIKMWMNKGMLETPEEIESYFEALIYPLFEM